MRFLFGGDHIQFLTLCLLFAYFISILTNQYIEKNVKMSVPVMSIPTCVILTITVDTIPVMASG